MTGCATPPPATPLFVDIHRFGEYCRAVVDGRPIAVAFNGLGRGDFDLIPVLKAHARRSVLVTADDDVPYRCSDVVLAGLQSAGAKVNFRTIGRAVH